VAAVEKHCSCKAETCNCDVLYVPGNEATAKIVFNVKY
jgi:hypothetical protein